MEDEKRNTPDEELNKDNKPDEAPDETAADAPADNEAEETPEPEQDETQETPEQSEFDELKAENLRLKTQVEAMKIGFDPKNVDDAVTLAEAIVKRDGKDIAEALNAVAEKYPDWKIGGKEKKSPSGFRVGADSSEKKPETDQSRLSAAFGLKKRKEG